MSKPNITPRRRANMERLADYLESLPADYEHFDMEAFFSHDGECDLVEGKSEAEVFTADPNAFLSNCGTVACAIGHAPSAGIPLAKAHIRWVRSMFCEKYLEVDWDAYAKQNFFHSTSHEWEWMFGGDWGGIDNHHYGAAARIRYLLDGKSVPLEEDDLDYQYTAASRSHVALYAPYRKAA